MAKKKYVAGLDWSGDSGKISKSAQRSLTIAIAHIALSDLPLLSDAFVAPRRRLTVAENYCFNHQGASARTHDEFFATVHSLPIAIHAILDDKSMWPASYLRSTAGPDRINHALFDLISRCPDDLVDGQRLWVDLPRSEQAMIEDIRTGLRRVLRSAQRYSFRSVDPRPDDGPDGEIVQVADMIAGEINEQGDLSGPYLTAIAHRVTIV